MRHVLASKGVMARSAGTCTPEPPKVLPTCLPWRIRRLAASAWLNTMKSKYRGSDSWPCGHQKGCAAHMERVHRPGIENAMDVWEPRHNLIPETNTSALSRRSD